MAGSEEAARFIQGQLAEIIQILRTGNEIENEQKAIAERKAGLESLGTGAIPREDKYQKDSAAGGQGRIEDAGKQLIVDSLTNPYQSRVGALGNYAQALAGELGADGQKALQAQTNLLGINKDLRIQRAAEVATRSYIAKLSGAGASINQSTVDAIMDANIKTATRVVEGDELVTKSINARFGGGGGSGALETKLDAVILELKAIRFAQQTKNAVAGTR